MNRRQFLATAAAGARLAAVPSSVHAIHEGGDFLDIQGGQIVKNGNPIRLRGANLGHWMILELL